MKIAATMVSMEAAKNYTEVDTTNTLMQQGPSWLNSINQSRTSLSGQSFQQNLFSLIHSSTTAQQSGSFSVSSDQEITDTEQLAEDSDTEQSNSETITSMVEHITGTSVTMRQIRGSNQNPTNGRHPLAIGLASLTSSSVHYEEESIFFQAAGEVQTVDGNAISFNLGLQMQRQELSIQSAGMRSGVYGIDPLVLNFDDTISIFDENYFSFDLDGDGEKENLSGLGSCCGFLALDRDGDGEITSGLELFGPSTNSGFGELADLDDDGNSWIDENDPIFDDLMVWMGVGGENEKLISLREAGVGAISVSHLGTQFNLESPDGTVQGIVQQSGLFLMENGEPKSMLEIDLVPQRRPEEVIATNDESKATGQLHTVKGGAFISSIDQDKHHSLENLWDIIFWQKMKMQIMLGKKTLNESRNEMVDRLNHLSSRTTLSMLS